MKVQSVAVYLSLLFAGSYAGKHSPKVSPAGQTAVAGAWCENLLQAGAANADVLDCSNIASGNNINVLSGVFPGGTFQQSAAAQTYCKNVKQIGGINVSAGSCSNILSGNNVNIGSQVGRKMKNQRPRPIPTPPPSTTQIATAGTLCKNSAQLGLANISALDCSNVASGDNINLFSKIGSGKGTTQKAQAATFCKNSDQEGLLNVSAADCSNILSGSNINVGSVVS